MNNELVSVVMPAHNSEKYILLSIMSVLEQTHSNLELLIVDDNSTDDTVRIVESIKDKRITLFKNHVNMGAAFCRNLAIQKSKGVFIAFLDSDDLWLPTKLEEQIDFMSKNSYFFTYTKYTEVDKLDIEISGPETITFKKLLRCNYIGCLTVMYKREIFPDLSIPNNILRRNDYALWLLLSKKESCHLLPKVLSKYRTGSTSSLSSISKRKLVSANAFMFKQLFNISTLKSYFYALRNVFYTTLKKFRWRRTIK